MQDSAAPQARQAAVPQAAQPDPAPTVAAAPPAVQPRATQPGSAQPPAAGTPGQQDGQPGRISRRRRVRVPAILFLATCFTTFLAGTTGGDLLTTLSEPATVFANHWSDGLVYMAALMAILMAHEMGHFLQAVRYRIPASLPFFLPMPLWRIGTMGAFIGMRGSDADRRQLFDIGLTGPWAGLAVALPLAWFGMLQAEAIPRGVDGYFGNPLLFVWLAGWLHPHDPAGWELIHAGNPMLMAAWVGMLVTGLNMLPIGQLDGGHVAYALFGRWAHLLAWLMAAAVVLFIILAQQFGWVLMLGLILLLGVRHPPTRNDTAPLGLARRVIGLASLSIPIFCLTPIPFSI
ncbi:MAG: site-2 protease family protein [Pirellulales bacterium]